MPWYLADGEGALIRTTGDEWGPFAMDQWLTSMAALGKDCKQREDTRIIREFFKGVLLG